MAQASLTHEDRTMMREGTLIIRKFPDYFSVTFCRNDHGGVLSPLKAHGEEALADAMKEIGFDSSSLKRIAGDLDREGTAFVTHVQLTDRQRWDLSLVSPDEGIDADRLE